MAGIIQNRPRQHAGARRRGYPGPGGPGSRARNPVSRRKPYKTCYVRGKAEAWVAQNPERFYSVMWGDIRR